LRRVTIRSPGDECRSPDLVSVARITHVALRDRCAPTLAAGSARATRSVIALRDRALAKPALNRCRAAAEPRRGRT
jgi:hypothetical protein